MYLSELSHTINNYQIIILIVEAAKTNINTDIIALFCSFCHGKYPGLFVAFVPKIWCLIERISLNFLMVDRIIKYQCMLTNNNLLDRKSNDLLICLLLSFIVISSAKSTQAQTKVNSATSTLY